MEDNKKIVIEKTKNGKDTTYSTKKIDNLKDYPLVIITDKYTASASEILTAALKDNRGIKSIGQTTFGKGVVQQIYELRDGGSLKLTVAEWFSPNGTKINEVGIEPDFRVRTVEDSLQKVLDTYDWEKQELID